MKIGPVGAELSHADRRTDMIKLTVAFCNSAKAPKKSGFLGKKVGFRHGRSKWKKESKLASVTLLFHERL
jgi:hypothetical protein